MPQSALLSRQAAYQRRRRAKQRPVTFFPGDRARLDRAVEESGLEQQAWMARAVEERIERQAKLKELLGEAVSRFKAKCFWNVNIDRPLRQLVPEAVTRLKKYGGMEGIKLAIAIEALAPEDVRWR
ncbi:MAG TPA: hypothetical protein VE397_06465 [Stellaceae bacterium]|nr:hypothetical protein [Stellaceae bacterium]